MSPPSTPRSASRHLALTPPDPRPPPPNTAPPSLGILRTTSPTPTSPSPPDHVLQVIFDAPPTHGPQQRRRASHSTGTTSPTAPTTCFVHALLETPNQLLKPALPSSPGTDLITLLNDHHATFEKFVDAEAGNLGACGAFSKMTKQQLNDMALGVRELSKHLASMVIHMRIKTVFILTKPGDAELVEYTRVLAEWLLLEGYVVYVDYALEGNKKFNVAEMNEGGKGGKLRYWTAKMCAEKPHAFDLVVTLGGDGTVLYASWLFQTVVPPIMSFALGSLGFLTKFDFEDHEGMLKKAVNQGVSVGLRLRFEATVMRAMDRDADSPRLLGDDILSEQKTHQADGALVILNEIVVDRGPNPTLSTTEIYCDDMFLTTVSADGVCVATPTGSTAYSLAAGGSLTHPDLPGMLVTVICAHSLNFRPLILPDGVALSIGVPYNARTTAWVSFDGRHRVELCQGDYVSIVASRFPFPIIQNKKDNKDWFDSIRRTMNWGDRVTQKPLTK